MDWNPTSSSLGALGRKPSVTLGNEIVDDESFMDGSGGRGETSTVAPQPQSDTDNELGPSASSLVAAPVPTPPSLSIQAPPSPSSSVRAPPGISPVDKNLTQLSAPTGTQGDYDHLTYDKLHSLRHRRG